MSEATEQAAISSSPLDEAHARLGALMREEGGRRLPASYGDVLEEYRTVREGGAGLIDLSSRGLIEVSGSEAVQFLNGLITNDVRTLAERSWMRAAFPNAQGRLVATACVLRLEGERFLFDTEAATHERVLKTLERFTLAGDFQVRDLTNELAHLSLQGARAAGVLRRALGEEAARVEQWRILTMQWNGAPLSLVRATQTAEKGFDLFVDAARAAALWDALLEAGASAVGLDALEILRLEAGIARYGVDMDETNVVLEAVPDEAVSFTKGCYVGQEIIARIHWRGHVAKKLSGLVFDEQGEASPGDKIRTVDGKEIGRLTSVTDSPRLKALIALGYLKYDYLAAGTQVLVLSGERELRARVVELPFVRGSWFDDSGKESEAGG